MTDHNDHLTGGGDQHNNRKESTMDGTDLDNEEIDAQLPAWLRCADCAGTLSIHPPRRGAAGLSAAVALTHSQPCVNWEYGDDPEVVAIVPIPDYVLAEKHTDNEGETE